MGFSQPNLTDTLVRADARTVSVIIPSYRAAGTIERAVSSALGQSLPPFEIIVVDDCSDDGTADTVDRAFGTLVTVIRMTKNAGASAARNLGIRHAAGEYVAFLDADDTWLPTKLAQQLDQMDLFPTAGLVTCGAWLVALNGSRTRAADLIPQSTGPEAWRQLLLRNFIPTPTVLARRSSLNAVGGFDEKLMVGEDWDLWMRLALHGSIVSVDEELVVCNSRPGSLMRSYAHREGRELMPVLRAWLSRVEGRLTRTERRKILGRRLFDFAFREYTTKASLLTLPLFLEAAVVGYRPLRSLTFVVRIPCGVLLDRFRAISPKVFSG